MSYNSGIVLVISSQPRATRSADLKSINEEGFNFDCEEGTIGPQTA